MLVEGFRAVETEIDLLAVGGAGELVGIRVGERAEDLSLVTRALSDLSWLRQRAAGLAALAPEIGIDPDALPRAIVVCEEPGLEAREAVEALAPGRVRWMRQRRREQQGRLVVDLEPCAHERGEQIAEPARRLQRDPTPPARRPVSSSPAAADPDPGKPSAGRAGGTEEHLPIDSPSPSTFRTGLRESDLERPAAGIA